MLSFYDCACFCDIRLFKQSSICVTCSAHTHRPPVALGTNAPRETGVVRGEALFDALVPVHRWVSTCDGSRGLSHGPFVWVVNVNSLFYGFITTSIFILC